MKKCKHCKEKFEPRFKTTEKYCWKDECKAVEVKLFFESKKKQQEKEVKAKIKERKPYVYSADYKKKLQASINKLSRMIDGHFGYFCIDCDKPFGKQADASHFHNVGGNENIRWNLHNVHTSRSYCNQWGRGRKAEYRLGVIKRYGEKYMELIEFEIGVKYKYVGLNEVEVVEKLTIVKSLIRKFDKIMDGKNFVNGLVARDYFNEEIGIYQ